MAWDDDKSTATDPDNPNADEQLTADEWDGHVLSQKNGRPTAWVVYGDGSTWYAEGQDGDSGTSGTDPATVLQYALDRGDTWLVDSIPADDPITSTVSCGSSDFVGPGSRGSGVVYIDTDQADPGIKMSSTGTFRDGHFRGDPDTVSGTFGGGTLLRFEDMGRGSLVSNVSVFGTRGNGIEVAGCQQMRFVHITTSVCGDVGSDTWHLYLTDSPSQDLETNANNWIDIQRHGEGGVDGGWIAMRSDQGPSTDRPRTQQFIGINVENGPSTSGVPMVEVTGRDHVFMGGRIGNIDHADAFFQVPSGAGRARDVKIQSLKCIEGSAHSMHFWDANGLAVATPYVDNCLVDVSGTGILLDNYNQTNRGLKVSNSDFKSTPTILSTPNTSKDAGDPVTLSNVHGGGDISVQGARLAVSNVPEANWVSQNAEFGPRLIGSDGSFTPAFFSADTSGGNGVAQSTFSGDFELKGGFLHAETGTGATGSIVEGTTLTDTNADGDLDTARARVVNTSDGTTVSDGVTVNFYVQPRPP